MYQYPLRRVDFELRTLPASVAVEIDEFFSEPKKRGVGGREVRLDLVSLTKRECELLARVVNCSKASTTLEIGLASGSSAIAILAAKRAAGIVGEHTALDPFQHDFANVGLMEIEGRGLTDGFSFLPRFSEEYLAWAKNEGFRYDFIFVDGLHTIGQKVTDAFMVDGVMRPGALVAFHDGLLFSTAAAVRYLIRERGFMLVRLRPDSVWKARVRTVRYLPSLGAWYCRGVVPHIFKSIVLLRAPDGR